MDINFVSSAILNMRCFTCSIYFFVLALVVVSWAQSAIDAEISWSTEMVRLHQARLAQLEDIKAGKLSAAEVPHVLSRASLGEAAASAQCPSPAAYV